MAVSSLVAASSGKTMYRTTLTSGTSWTVPAGVTYVNVTLMGGGGGGGRGNDGTQNVAAQAISFPGQVISSTVNTTPGASITYAIGAGGAGSANANTAASTGGTTTFTGATSAAGGNGGFGGNAGNTPLNGTSASNASNFAVSGHGSAAGSNGGAGKIDVEYWV